MQVAFDRLDEDEKKMVVSALNMLRVTRFFPLIQEQLEKDSAGVMHRFAHGSVTPEEVRGSAIKLVLCESLLDEFTAIAVNAEE